VARKLKKIARTKSPGLADSQPSNGKKEMQFLEATAPPELRRGVFSNFALVSHTEQEFILNFFLRGGIAENDNHLVARVILTPDHAKRLIQAMKDNYEKYEERVAQVKKGSKN